MTEDDQRRASRIPVDLPARCWSETLSVDGRAENLSQDGMLFVGHGPEVAGGFVELEIDLPDADGPLLLGGEIAWVTEGPRFINRTVGIRFTRVETLVRRRLANFVIRRSCKS